MAQHPNQDIPQTNVSNNFYISNLKSKTTPEEIRKRQRKYNERIIEKGNSAHISINITTGWNAEIWVGMTVLSVLYGVRRMDSCVYHSEVRVQYYGISRPLPYCCISTQYQLHLFLFWCPGGKYEDYE